MSEQLTWFVGNRNPSISEVITTGAGTIIDLTTSTVRFKARVLNTETLIVNQPVSNSPGADGVVRYDWSATDIAANGVLADPHQVLIWWEVTTGGKAQDYKEAIIVVVEHAPLLNAYVELEEFKSTAELTNTSFADQDIQNALLAASRGIDTAFHRRYWLDTDDTSVRYYSPNGGCTVEIDDIVDVTSIVSDRDGDGTFEETWVENTDFVLEPLNAAEDGKPWETIRIHPNGSYSFSSYPRSLKVTGQFGWPAVPAEVKQATTMIATRLLKLAREAPFGVVALGFEGEAVRVARFGADFEFLRDAVGRAQVLA